MLAWPLTPLLKAPPSVQLAPMVKPQPPACRPRSSSAIALVPSTLVLPKTIRTANLALHRPFWDNPWFGGFG